MAVDMLREGLGWCAIINMGIILYWFLMFVLAHDFVYRMHSRWFKMSVEQFDMMQYAGIGLYKILVIVFNILPYIALVIMT